MEEEFISFKLWKQIKNTAIYISKSGGCVTKNLRTGLHYQKIIVGKNNRGHSHYPFINLSGNIKDGNKRIILYPHRAVALTYLPNHDIFKNQVDHLDGNIFNNNLWNLEWVTEAENHRRAAEAKKRKEKKMYQIVLNGVPMWSVNGRNFATKEEAEAYEQKILEYYETHQCTGD